MKTVRPKAAVALFALSLSLVIGYGCGLGYLEPSAPAESLTVRIENRSENDVDITVVSSPIENQEEDAPDAELPLEGESELRQAQIALNSEATIRVAAGAVTLGAIRCDAKVRISAVVADNFLSTVTLMGDGTGTTGFDSGSIGLQGERVLFNSLDFECADTILVRVTSDDGGEVRVVRPDEPFPGPLNGDPSAPQGELTFRLENATASDANVLITGIATDGRSPPDPVQVLVPAGEFTSGAVACGFTYRIEGTIAGTVDNIIFDGDGTGTEGFDSGSVGQFGERFLVQFVHYGCGQTVVVAVTDDGSGVGSSVSETPIGAVTVYNPGELPPPDLGPPDEGGDEGDPPAEQVRVSIRNQTGAFVQVSFTSGTGSGDDPSVDVRVPPLATSEGRLDCAQRFTIGAHHLEDADSNEGSGFHTVILLGDGTGAEGFDGNNVGTDNTRTLKLDEHYQCGDLIEISIESTGNSVDPDSGDLIYGIGSGTVDVIG